MLEQMVFISANFQQTKQGHTQQISATGMLGLELHFLLEVLECWNRWFLYQQICSNLNWAVPVDGFAEILLDGEIGRAHV